MATIVSVSTKKKYDSSQLETAKGVGDGHDDGDDDDDVLGAGVAKESKTTTLPLDAGADPASGTGPAASDKVDQDSDTSSWVRNCPLQGANQKQTFQSTSTFDLHPVHFILGFSCVRILKHIVLTESQVHSTSRISTSYLHPAVPSI